MLLSPVVTTRCAVPRCRAVLSQHLIGRPGSREVHTLAAYRAADDPLVTTDWLAQRLTEVTVLDVRGHVDTVLVNPGEEQSTYRPDYDAYLEGHIPGAVFWDWTKDGLDLSASAQVQLQTEPDLLAAALEAKGVSSETPVVAYDSGDGMFAARLWWLLTVAGHPAAFVLEGGWNKWRAEQRPSELYEPCTLKVYGCFEADMQLQLRATLEDLQQLPQLAAQTDPASRQQQPSDALILDTRNVQQYKGEVRRGPRGGRIPGAVSLPRAQLLNEDTALFKPLEQQKQLLQQAGVQLTPGGQQRVVLYCNGGVAACTGALALHRLGHRDWAVYDGSWNEYSRADSMPVERQAAPTACHISTGMLSALKHSTIRADEGFPPTAEP